MINDYDDDDDDDDDDDGYDMSRLIRWGIWSYVNARLSVWYGERNKLMQIRPNREKLM
jgi:hypothetical protein